MMMSPWWERQRLVAARGSVPRASYGDSRLRGEHTEIVFATCIVDLFDERRYDAMTDIHSEGLDRSRVSYSSRAI